MSLNGVSIKLPQLWTNCIQVVLLQALPEQTADRIPALLQSPPAGDPYQALKNKLISMYNQTNFQRAELLTALPSATADMRLSELLNRMLALLPLEEVNRQGFLFIHMLLMPSVGNSATGTASTMTFGEQMPGWSCRCMCQRPCNFLGYTTGAGQEELTKPLQFLLCLHLLHHLLLYLHLLHCLLLCLGLPFIATSALSSSE